MWHAGDAPDQTLPVQPWHEAPVSDGPLARVIGAAPPPRAGPSPLFQRLWGAAALVLASAVFIADILPNLSAAVSILYLAVLMLGTLGRGRRAVLGWTALCVSLTVAGYLKVHLHQHDVGAILRMGFSLVALLITCALLLSRLEVQAARDEVRQLAGSLEQRVAERTDELGRSERRFRSLFYDMNIAFAETDTSDAKQVIVQAKAAGIGDFQKFAGDAALLERAIAGIRLIHVNDAVAHLLGYETAEQVMALPRDTYFEESDQALAIQVEAIFEERRRSNGSSTFIRRDGNRIVLAYQVNYPSDWTYGLATYVDITEQQLAHEMVLAANEELARANRVATMGALSTSLAHELNQPITTLAIDIQTCLRFLRQEPPNVAEGMGAVERLSRNVERMVGIVRRTREQLVKGRRTLQPVDLCELARETQALLQRDLSIRGATLRLMCGDDIPAVTGDRVELQQVLVNLVINGADAMMQVQDRERTIDIGIARSGDEDVAVVVADSGPGIPEEHRARIFQPFFTTKPEGMGMGLQICRSLIEGLGGDLTVENRAGGGAMFRFVLPVSEGETGLG